VSHAPFETGRDFTGKTGFSHVTVQRTDVNVKVPFYQQMHLLLIT